MKRLFYYVMAVLLAFYAHGCSSRDGGSGSWAVTGAGAVTGAVTGRVTTSSSVVFAPADQLSASPIKKIKSSKTILSAATVTIPVPGAICTVEGTDKSGTTDENGVYTIDGVPTGSHILICKKTVADGSTYAFLEIIEISNGQTLDMGPLEVTLAGAMQGKATMTGRTDHTGIKVYIPGTSFQATTDATGAFLINNVPAGSYELRFESTGYITVSLTGFAVNSGETTVLSDVALNIFTGASGVIAIENGRTYASSRTVSAAVSATADAALMMVSEDPNFVNSTWQTIVSPINYTFASDGQKRLYIRFSDANGLESAPVSDDIIVDTTPPDSAGISINSGVAATNSSTVTLGLSATDAATSVSQMMISNTADFSGATWETFDGTRSWTLPSGDGMKTVYAKFRDIVGNETITPVSASILLDTQSPTNPGGSILEGSYTNNRFIHLLLTASSASFVKISEDPSFAGVSPVAYAASTPYTLSSGDGTKTVYVRYLDDAGNIIDFTLPSIILDTVAPTAPVLFNQNQTTSQTTFAVTLSTASADANFGTYQVNGGQYADWTDTAETGTFSFTLSQQGVNYLYIRGKDLAGNVSSQGSVIVTLDTVQPVITNFGVQATGTTAKIKWWIDESGYGLVSYGLNQDYGSGSQADLSTGTYHEVTLTSLTQNTLYHYKITSTDLAGNVGESTDLTFKTGKEVSGVLTESTTWTAEESPIIVMGNILVSSSVTLTVQPGVEIKFDTDTCPICYLQVEGTLVAMGTPLQKIKFTTNVVSPSTTGVYWGFSGTAGLNGIRFQDSSADATFDAGGNYTGGSVLQNTIIEYGTGISINNSAPWIDHDVLQNNYNYDWSSPLFFTGSGSPKISNNIIIGSGYDLAAVHVQGGSPVLEYNTIAGGIYATNNPIIRYNSISGCAESENPFMRASIIVQSSGVSFAMNHNNISNDCYRTVYMKNAAISIDASNNYWGTTDTAIIDTNILDWNDDFALGKVIYSPILSSPESTAAPQ